MTDDPGQWKLSNEEKKKLEEETGDDEEQQAQDDAVEVPSEEEFIRYLLSVELKLHEASHEKMKDQLHTVMELKRNPRLPICARKKKRKRASMEGKEPPKSIMEAITNPDANEAARWVESVNKEWDGFNKLGVFEHGWTRQQLIDAGAIYSVSGGLRQDRKSVV